MAVARLEKRPAEVETPVETSELERIPPLPLPPPQFPHVPITPPTIGLYDILTPGTLVGVLLPRKTSSELAKTCS